MSCGQDCNQGRNCTCDDGLDDIGELLLMSAIAIALAAIAMVLLYAWIHSLWKLLI